MRRITRVILGWAVLWLVAVWVIDAASNVYGLGPPALHLPKRSGWLLFEVWAIGFVVLGAIWNKVPVGPDSIEQARRDDRPLRTVTWAILGWTGLWNALFVAWALDPAGSSVGEEPGSGGPAALKPPEFVLFAVWLLGFVALGAIWTVRQWSSTRQHGS